MREHTPLQTHRSEHSRLPRRAIAGVTLVEALIVLALCALALMAAASSLGKAIDGGATQVAAHIRNLTPVEELPSSEPANDTRESPPPAPREEPKREKKKGGGFWGKAWTFVLDNAPIVSEVRTLMDPNASWLDKGLAVVSLASYATPAGPAVKVLAKGASIASKARKADKAVDAARDVERGADAAKGAAKKADAPPKVEDPPEVAAGKKRRPDEEECPDGICQVPGQCFAAGTLIYTEQGDRPIETIAQGDRVWARDPASGALALKTVLQLFEHDSLVVDVAVTRDHQVEHLTVTPNHPFWVEGRGWQAVGQLLEPAQVWSPDGLQTAHAAAAWGERTKVYNFEVEDSHTYFVGELHTWVHNRGPERCPDPGDYPSDHATKNTVDRSAKYASERDARNLARTKLGKDPVEVEPGKWRSRDGRWQYRAKPNDLKGHGPKDGPHVHLERLDPVTGEVLENWHLRW